MNKKQQRDFERFKDVYGLWYRGYNQLQIAELLELPERTVSNKLAAMRKKYPQLFGTTPTDKPRITRYDKSLDDRVKEQF
jgi:hypothetical protein